MGHNNIDDDTSLHELQSLDLEEPDWRALSSSTQRPTSKLSSEAPELKEARRKTQTEGSEAATVAPSHRGPIQPKKGVIQWETVKCETCGKVSGQYKKDPSPGSRDKATYYYRVHANEVGGALVSQASCL